MIGKHLILNHIHFMKGVVFTEFLEMVEQKFGMEMVNALIENNELSTDGVYSAVGTYHTPRWCPGGGLGQAKWGSPFQIC